MDDEPPVTCGDCGMEFWVIWNRSPLYARIEHCPFCGEELTEDCFQIPECEPPAA